jgi:hypothetical protein
MLLLKVIMDKQLNYNTILHQSRKKLNLTLMEYCIADSVYHLSNNPKSKVHGWCFASKDHLAMFLGTTKATIFSNLNKLIEKGLVERDEETRYLRTTEKWYEEVIIKDSKETIPPIKKLDSEVSRNLIADSKETLHYNNSYNNKDNNTFEEFWKAYPRKENKKKSKDLWVRKKLGEKLPDIISFIERARETERWEEGYIPQPTTFLNGERWEDDIRSYNKTNEDIEVKIPEYAKHIKK